ncbi:MAG: NAD(P)-dependent oxidoreductase [Candidatus Binatia bacterium]
MTKISRQPNFRQAKRAEPFHQLLELSMANLGFVGLGVMGSRMVKRLLDAGHTVTGHNRTKSKAQWLVNAGMKWANTPRAAAQAGDLVFTMVTNTEALQAVTDGADGILAGLGPGKVYIDMSTVSPAASREIAQQVSTKGAKMLDAPVSGSVATIEEGKLTFMVAGEREVFERVEPILRDIGQKATYVGTNGLAVAMKIATNLSLVTQMLAFSEGVLLAEKSGIAREVAVEVLLNSVAASPMLKYRGPFVLKLPEAAWADCNMMQKDLLLALEMGRSLNVPLPTTATTNEFLTAARGLGLDKKDFAVLFEVLAKMAGQK